MFAVGVVVVDGDFDGHVGFRIVTFHVHDLGDQRSTLTGLIKHLHEFGDTAFREEFLPVDLLVFVEFPLIRQGDADIAVQIGKFPQTAFEDIFIIDTGGEDGQIGPEMHGGAGAITGPGFADRVLRSALGIFLFKFLAFAFDDHMQFGTQGVDATDTHAVQTAGYLVSILVELTTGM